MREKGYEFCQPNLNMFSFTSSTGALCLHLLRRSSRASSSAASSLPPQVARRLELYLAEKDRQHANDNNSDVDNNDIGIIPVKTVKQLLSNEDERDPERTEVLRTYWHSAAHVLGQAMEIGLKNSDGKSAEVLLCDGPPLVGEGSDQGFYYQVALPDGVTIDDTTRGELEQTMKLICREKQEFERLEVDREFARNLFVENPYKISLLDRIPSGEIITVYRNGPFVDLCRGPHVSDTSLFGAVKLLKTSASHFRLKSSSLNGVGDEGKKGEEEEEEEEEEEDATTSSIDIMAPVQRVYGITFRKPKELKVYEKQMKMARERDHRLIGTQQELFMFDSSSPGSPFFLPHGTKIINRLKSHLRTMYWNEGYDEVRTPMIFHKKLWETSGHLQNYSEDMYGVVEGFGGGCGGGDHGGGDHGGGHENDGNDNHDVNDNHDGGVTEYGLKPMNCPAHCIMFKNTKRSYRDLPIRMADFGALHRNENSGSLRGLTRVRCFHQDDAHIFCTEEQIANELLGCLRFVDEMYVNKFDFDSIDVNLSTRPLKKAGTDEQWDVAESELEKMLEEYGKPWSFNDGDGAFYGPKIDIRVRDIMGRYHQVATVQLDFQLPNNFNLLYVDSNGEEKRPVMVHRAVLGSLERMVAVLCEHWGGRWPMWLSPRQVAVLPVSDVHSEYAKEVRKRMRIEWSKTSSEPLHEEMLDGSDTLKKRISLAQRSQFNYVLVVGDEEEKNGTVNVRTRNGKILGEMKMEELNIVLKRGMEEEDEEKK